MCLDQLEVQGTDLRPMYRRDEGHFPGRPFLFLLCFCGWLAGWHWSSLISSEPTGLFFYLCILSSRRQLRSCFHILFLFNSLADSEANHFPSRCKVLYLYLSPALYPRQRRYLTSQSVSHSAPPYAVSCVVSPLYSNTEFFLDV